VSWFRISFAENAFRRLLKARGLQLETMTIDEGIDAMTAFHTEHRAQHTEGGEDSLKQRRRGDTLIITRRMTRSDNDLSHTLTLTVSSAGARLDFS
jgi:hypothetical protein